MTSFHQITAYNTQALYFWGTEADADRYVDWLNRDREINVYSAQPIPEADWGAFEGRDDILSGEEPGWDDFMDSEENMADTGRKPLTAADVREIAATCGFSHAEFCVEQDETQFGSDALTDARDELRRIERSN